MKWTACVSLILLGIIVGSKSESYKPPPIVCDDPHEHYECGSACQTRCIRLDCSCYIQTFVCVPGCFCDPGYARDENDVCIPRFDCRVPRNCSAPEPGYGPAP